MRQHPQDLKPRGVKPPMHLIPWSVVPDAFCPEALQEAAVAIHEGEIPGVPRSMRMVKARTDHFAFRLAHDLISRVGLEAVADVFGYGAKKYAPWNWQTFTWDQAAEDEYWGAICRHLAAAHRGEERAEDSGCLHEAHAAAGCLIWLWHVSQKPAAGEAGADVPDPREVEPAGPAVQVTPVKIRVFDRVKHVGSEPALLGVVEEIDTNRLIAPYLVRWTESTGARFRTHVSADDLERVS